MTIFIFNFPTYAENNNPVSFGITFMIGERYDNLRMCVATPPGVKGGPLGDIMLNIQFHVTGQFDIAVKVPVMRPILFGFAFKMLQFEPEVDFLYKKEINNKIYFVSGGGIGLSFHYGPDYKSDNENKGESFFAIGPLLSGYTGFGFAGQRVDHRLALKALYIPLFAGNKGVGTVIGGALDYSIIF